MSENVRVFAKYVETKKNFFADAILRAQFGRFDKLVLQHDRMFQERQEIMPVGLIPELKVWKLS